MRMNEWECCIKSSTPKKQRMKSKSTSVRCFSSFFFWWDKIDWNKATKHVTLAVHFVVFVGWIRNSVIQVKQKWTDTHRRGDSAQRLFDAPSTSCDFFSFMFFLPKTVILRLLTTFNHATSAQTYQHTHRRRNETVFGEVADTSSGRFE